MPAHPDILLEELEWEGVCYRLKPDGNREAMRLEAWPVGASAPGWSETLPHPQFYRCETALRAISGQLQIWLEGRHSKGDHPEEFLWCFGPDGKPRKALTPGVWDALQHQERCFLLKALEGLAEKQWTQDEAGPLKGSRCGVVHVELLAVKRRDWVTVVRFAFDYFLDYFAQSGSDWADHLLYLGTAEFHGFKLRRSDFAQVHKVEAILDRDREHYQADVTRREVREREIARMTLR